MNRGFYAMATGMLVERQRMDVLTNNIVNVETAGFKKDTLVSRSFEDVLIERINDPNVRSVRNIVGEINHGVHIDEIKTDFTQGNTEVTDRVLDLLIEGEGLFVVDTPNGERYTRSGSFVLDSEGVLRTSEGYAVLGQNGQIQVPADFAVSPTGVVTSNLQEIDTLRIVSPENWDDLRKQGENLYYVYGDAQPPAATNFSLRQGALEMSNANMAREMVDLITTSRTYETGQKILRIIDETTEKACTRIASV